MSILLLFPPYFSFYQPYVALPSLVAFLRNRGICVSLQDCNIASFHWFLKQKYLSGLLEILKSRKNDFEKRDILSDTEFDYYNAVVRAILAGNVAIYRIEEALDFFRTPETFSDFEKYVFFERVIQDCFRLISTVYYPSYISLTDFEMQYSPQSSQQIFDSIEDSAQNPYIQFFEEYLPDKMPDQALDLIGISLTSASQIIPAFTLARILKTKQANIRIVIGGVMASHLADKIKAIPKLFTLFDYLIRGEGETPLHRLCLSISEHLPLSSVPNLIYRDNDVICENEKDSLEKVDSLPTPDYTDLPLDQYLAPIPVLSIEPARGCYWRKCTFCNQYNIHGDSFRKRSVHLVIADIVALKNEHGVVCFNISNEGVPERHLTEMAKAIIEDGLQIQWYAGVQLKGLSHQTCNLLRQAGCRKLIFGLESGCQRVLNLMNKGIDLNEVPKTIQNCTDSGIDIHLYLMIGFPTETFHEIEATRDCVLSLVPYLRKDGFTFYISTFQAMIQAPILEHLQDFGYSVARNEDVYDLEYIFDWELNDKVALGYSKNELEQISCRIAEDIYQQLPAQILPEEMTHYMCFVSQGTRGHQFRRCRKEESLDIELNDDISIIRNDMVSMLEMRLLGGSDNHGLEGGAVAYNLSTGKYFLLNCAAVRIISNLQFPTKLHILFKEDSFPKEEFQLYIKRLIEEDIVSIKED